MLFDKVRYRQLCRVNVDDHTDTYFMAGASPLVKCRVGGIKGPSIQRKGRTAHNRSFQKKQSESLMAKTQDLQRLAGLGECRCAKASWGE